MMADPYWAAAGPSRPTASSFVTAPAPTLAKKKRGRFSDPSKNASIPSIINPPSPELVPRHSSSASSWGIEDLSDSDGDYDWPTPLHLSTGFTSGNAATAASPDLDRDELARFARPSKRVHLETPEDRHTYGQMAGLQIDSSTLAASLPNSTSFGRPQGARMNSGVAGAFGLSASLASAFGAGAEGLTSAPRVPPSSPTKADAVPSSFGVSASPLYQQAVAPAPPTSPSLADSGLAPPSSPLHSHSFDGSATSTSRPLPADLEDSDMRLRRGVPSSYEVEPDRIVVTSLDDTSSSEGDGSSEADGQKTPDADTSTESKDSSSDFVINNELMEKLEAHSRAVLTGTSDRDNAASNSRSGGASSSSSRTRRSGRRSAGSAVPSLGSLLSSKRRSAASSPGSSGYASPINAEDARGALILWKDPEEVLKSTSAATIPSPLKPSDLATVPESGPAPTSFMNQPPVSFQSGSSFSAPASNSSSMFGNTIPSLSAIPGMAPLPSPSHAESPLYAQQSSLSSSYFPEPSPLEARFSGHASQHVPQAFGAASTYPITPPGSHDGPSFGHGPYPASPFHGAPTPSPFGSAHQQSLHHYGHHHSSHSQATTPTFHPHSPSAHQVHQHTHAAGAQPIDLSGCFGPAEEMDLDS
ncbi:hypothetical protein PSEUBRA_001835 [Kalmanozyma brasiliensis GHG001]|uniref:uncharacterized protein n=1 Tax=Kalmanozyma brasiliensis (strain GHG001) TaxID=1365824 RepID=UPI002867B4C2|nr:uncharacterized protein PSEUBRA_001835 [Kalmanozyma brasiliensis GHG001]EST08423.2 hypothetical protein PSEUBRA_001835 [Kalmanozyma brasiliensis GHG001]